MWIKNVFAYIHQWMFGRDSVSYEWDDIDFDDTDEVKDYLKEQLAEGYLSVDEEAFVDHLIDEYDAAATKADGLEKLLVNRTENQVG